MLRWHVFPWNIHPLHTVPAFNSSTRCMGGPGIILDRTLNFPGHGCEQMSQTSQLNVVCFPSYVAH